MHKFYGSYRLSGSSESCHVYSGYSGSLSRLETLNQSFQELSDESTDDASNSHYSELSMETEGPMSLASSLSSLSLFPYTHRRRNSSASSNVSVTHSSGVHIKEILFFGFCDHVGQDLWKDNPEQDRFNTFSVSEADLTNVIGYLENQIEAHKYRSRDSESSDNVMNSVQDSLQTNIPPKVTFILDTYCHIYMYR